MHSTIVVSSKSQLAYILCLIGQKGSSPVFSDYLDGALCQVCKGKVNTVEFENKSENMEKVGR